MDIVPPLIIRVETDGNVLRFVKKHLKDKNRKENSYVYKYIKSNTKSGEIEFNEKYFKRMLNYSFKEIKENEI